MLVQVFRPLRNRPCGDVHHIFRRSYHLRSLCRSNAERLRHRKEPAMTSRTTLQSSMFFATARLAAMLTAALVLFADAASAEPRPGYPGPTTTGPTWAEVRENALLRAGVKVG